MRIGQIWDDLIGICDLPANQNDLDRKMHSLSANKSSLLTCQKEVVQLVKEDRRCTQQTVNWGKKY